MKTISAAIDPVTDMRFELVRPLGEGASGAVFLALDRETGEHVALKKLFKLDQKSVLRFKREFRSLADIHHPNLVKLYDLHRGQEAWFITMEYVVGQDLRQKLSADAAVRRTAVSPANDVANHVSVELLTAFYDLARGVQAIHRAGMLHRDLKPSNVLVGDNGRVVVLDFGLVREIDAENQLTQEGTVAGTPAYMPPEQALGDTLSEASDWYAFGVMLYEAISGVLPIDGRNARQLIHHKLSQDPAPLRSGASGKVLDLCMGLLARDPAQRPSGATVLQVLAAESGGAREPSTVQEHLTLELATTSTAQLFGRRDELERLKAASDDPTRDGSLVIHVRGTSGSGKSALVERFIDEAKADPSPPVVLRSRCYEREAMPFKALDGVMDALVGYLSHLDEVSCAHLMPTAVSDLTRLFPVLERLHVVQRIHLVAKQTGDESMVRRRAEQALRELITMVATRRRLLVWIDDLQWGDLDSASVLREWLDQPLAAPVTIVLSYRSEEVQTSSTLAVLLARTDPGSEQRQLTVDIGPLKPDDVRTLCVHRLGRVAPEAMIACIVREADGNPFLAQQLAAIAEAKLARHDTSLDGLSAEALMQRASAWMGESARALLNVLAVAGRPLRSQLALGAAGVLTAGRAHIHTLRSLRLVRTREVGGERLLEVYHDRVREVVQAGLPPAESQRIHADLMRELQTFGRGRSEDHEWLHMLALGARQRSPAFSHGWLAAKRAGETLAFEHAAELYSKCLVLFDGEVELHTLWTALAQAQAHCRRGYDAAKAYMSAAEHAPVEQRGELWQLAASHLVRSGRFEEGERIVQQVLHAYDARIPRSRAGLFAALVWEYARIALRRLDVPASRSMANAPPKLQRLGLLYGPLSIETQLYAPLRAALFQARTLRLALDYGDSHHASRALSLAAAIACVTGTQRAARRSADLLHHADRLMKRDAEQQARLEVMSARTVCALFLGQLDKVLEPSSEVDRLTRSKSALEVQGDYYYMFAVLMARISALQNMGQLIQARQLIHEFVARAHATDNLGALLQVTMNRVIDEQALDLCAGSRARLDAEYEKLPRAEFSVLNAVHVIAVLRAACSTRDFAWAFERIGELWQPYLRSLVHRSALLACLAHTTHARLQLNHYVETSATGDPKPLVHNDLKHLVRLPSTPLRDAAILRTRARVASLTGERDTAIALLRKSLAIFEGTAMLHEIAHDRYCLGALVGGADGAQLMAAGVSAFAEYGISHPEANMRAYVPELTR
ncbi:MAG: protein kinase [Polyangiales bacterium]